MHGESHGLGEGNSLGPTWDGDALEWYDAVGVEGIGNTFLDVGVGKDDAGVGVGFGIIC